MASIIKLQPRQCEVLLGIEKGHMCRVRQFCEKTKTENHYKITEITDITESFDQLNYCDQNKP